ncbi:MAG: DNA glycosylase [Thermoplasmata archaeon]
MRYFVEPDNPINLDFTLDSGQAFRWRKEGEIWEGIVRQKVCKLRQEGRMITFTGFTMEEFLEYFGLNLKMKEVVETSFGAPEVSHLPTAYKGLRILNQELYECLFSFLLATNTNIKRIKAMVEKICLTYGEKIEVAGRIYFGFPTPEKFLQCSEKIKNCSLGFRDSRILELAEKIVDGKINLERIATLDYTSARNALLEIKGVGPKVADCVCLFSLKHYMAFPIDVHISSWFRKQNYMELESVNAALNQKKMSDKIYRILSDFARKRFGIFAGYVQQYIFLNEIFQNARGKSPRSTIKPAITNAAWNP